MTRKKTDNSPKTALQIAEEQAATMAELVEVEALGLISYDGNPDVEGAEYYAPEGWQPDPDQVDEDGCCHMTGISLRDLPSRFMVSRGALGAMIKAKMVRLVGE